jgi:hypothetical protein
MTEKTPAPEAPKAETNKDELPDEILDRVAGGGQTGAQAGKLDEGPRDTPPAQTYP